ncbi:MAG TPA: tRNA lysidine(34) synthetase TilS [Solirubrobacteraceae bacterium]|nr:tRNA lysidine(34) synthetase TilS [Solirubrobacteraceae bacterium]
MPESALEKVRAAGIVKPGERVLALVSGGRDSTCLLDVLVSLLGAPSVAALHVNYGLRGGDSDGDEEHVRELCAALGVQLDVHRASRPPRSGNLQAWARDVRYARAIELLGPGALIATGHTRSDLAETVIHRLASSPGRRALGGIPAREGRLIRPLLSLTRADTRSHCEARGLRWRDDSSNADPRFARARIRHDVLPALEAVHPEAERNIAATAELLRAEGEVLDEVVATALAGRDRMSLERLAELPPALARLVVIRLAEDAAGALLPAIGGRLEEILALAHRGGSASIDVGRGVQAVVEYGVLRFARATTPAERAGEQALALPGTLRFGDWTLTAALEASAAPSASDPSHTAIFDADTLGALSVRGWRHGDRMRPAGRTSTRALSDLFTDRRVPRAERVAIPLLISGEEIAWVPGVASGERFQPQISTSRVAVLRARRA